MTSTTQDTRSLIVEREVDADPDTVWELLTDPEQLSRWFPLEARVEPGEGGKIWLSWGPGVAGEAPIHVWDPPGRLGWTEAYGNDEEGRPIRVAVDFHVEGEGGRTVVRLVQSGFGASADWDQMYDALKDGWTYFLFNLAFYASRHLGKARGMVWRRVATDLARDAAWERMVGGALLAAAGSLTPGAEVDVHLTDSTRGHVVSAREGYHVAVELPDLDDSLLFVELEGKHVGIWLSTYGQPSGRVEALQAALDARVEGLLA